MGCIYTTLRVVPSDRFKKINQVKFLSIQPYDFKVEENILDSENETDTNKDKQERQGRQETQEKNAKNKIKTKKIAKLFGF